MIDFKFKERSISTNNLPATIGSIHLDELLSCIKKISSEFKFENLKNHNELNQVEAKIIDALLSIDFRRDAQ